ncbi:MAG: putative toxin-antitoxin system toxin component, PIN family [Spirochaetaceae bacterium]|jgi:putative PIN family toxin of toxin-antitoxin system|nr:putative toxin-antitoxin system toxin component, PIN family [Spirochaetaceae bacterium]
MQRVVLDTNVLVSALWTPLGNPSTIVSLMLSDKITPYFDYRILAEYHAVLKRPKLSFSNNDVDKLLAEIERRGLSNDNTFSYHRRQIISQQYKNFLQCLRHS